MSPFSDIPSHLTSGRCSLAGHRSQHSNQMKQVLTIAVLILTVLSNAQEFEALRHCKSEEFKYDFYVLLKEKNLSLKDTVFYCWFRAQKIHHTQGQVGGDILDGPFFKYYHSGQLAEQGHFKTGLKVGEWKSWRSDGTLVGIFNYSGGALHGKYSLFDESGYRVKSGKYRSGLEPSQKPQKSKDLKEEPESIQGAEEPGFFKRLFTKDQETSGKTNEDSETESDEKQGFLKRLFQRDGEKSEKDKPQKEHREKREKSTPEKVITEKKDGND